MTILYILVICALFAAGKSQPITMQPYHTNLNTSVLHVDYYLNAHRLLFERNIWFYDYQIETLKTLYQERINTLLLQQNLLIKSVVQAYEYLIPLEFLCDSNKDCIEKYKKIIPPVSAVKYNTDNCINSAKLQLNSLIANPSSTNRTLQSYYINTFEKSAQACEKSHPVSKLNYTLCAQNAVLAANVYTLNNQKTFAAQMDSSASTAEVYVKRAMDCYFNENNSTIASTAQGKTHIGNCIRGLDNCNNCTGNYCENVFYLPASTIDYHNQTMRNVFYGSNPSVECLMLNVY